MVKEKRKENLEDVFNITSMDFISDTESVAPKQPEYEVWIPYLKNDTLQADVDVKLLMNINDPKRSFFELPHIYLNNEISLEKRFLYVNPVFNDWENNIFSSLYCGIKSSTDPLVLRHKEKFKISSRYYCLVQILDDEQNEELKNKIKIMRITPAIASKINEKIDEIKRECGKLKEELELYRQKSITDKSIDFEKEKKRIKVKYEQVKSNDPFRVIDGRVFRIKMRKKARDSYTQYDASEFRDQRVSVIIDGENCNDKDKIVEFLKENSPDLSKYKWEGYTEEEKKFICRIIIDYFPENSDIITKMKRGFPDIMDYANEFYSGKLEGVFQTVSKSIDLENTSNDIDSGEDNIDDDIDGEDLIELETTSSGLEEEDDVFDDFDNIDDIDFDLDD